MGDFLILKSDNEATKNGEAKPPLWRVDGKTLIQKYECTDKVNWPGFGKFGFSHSGFSGGRQVQKREHVLWLDVSNAAQVPDGEGEDVEVGGEGDLDRKAGISTSARRTD